MYTRTRYKSIITDLKLGNILILLPELSAVEYDEKLSVWQLSFDFSTYGIWVIYLAQNTMTS